MQAISVNNISKQFGDVNALTDINLNISRGELFGFIGPDGGGKTTLFRIIATLLIPNKGNVSVLDFDTVKDYKKIRKVIGYMPGRFSLYPDLSVEENLRFYATIFGTSINENYYLIKHIYQQLEPFRKRLAGKLSGGMKQKLALSCALIHKPQVLILDEPTTGVDAVSRTEFWEILRNLKNEGITILVSTPYMDEAKLCDRIALMQKGSIMAIDTPENIINNFEKELFTIRSDNIYRLLLDLKNYEFTHSVYPFGQFVHYTDKKENISQVKNKVETFLETKEHKNIVINKIKPNVEDCFMELMNK